MPGILHGTKVIAFEVLDLPPNLTVRRGLKEAGATATT